MNESYVRFRYNVFLEEGSKPFLKPDMQVRIALPQLREKTHLIISGVPKEETVFSATQAHAPTDQTVSPSERNVTTTVEYVQRQTPETSFILRTGVKFSTHGADLTLGPRYRVSYNFASGWTARIVEDVSWNSRTGWSSESTLDLERQLPRGFFFRSSADLHHDEHERGYLYAYSFVLTQPLGPRTALEYSWVNVFQTRPVNELMDIALRVNYRKRIWRDWLYFSLMPQLHFPRTKEFKTTPGILFSLDLVFGHYL